MSVDAHATPLLLPVERLHRATAAALPTLRIVVETLQPVAGTTWVQVFTADDRRSGRRPKSYSLDDPRFILSALKKISKLRGRGITSEQRSYIFELAPLLNRAAHERNRIDDDAADRGIDTMVRLVASFAANEAAEAVRAAGKKIDRDGPKKPDDAEPDKPGPEVNPEPGPGDTGEREVAEDDESPVNGSPGTGVLEVRVRDVVVRAFFAEAIGADALFNETGPLRRVVVENTGDHHVTVGRLDLRLVVLPREVVNAFGGG